jgi:hypothetical protein
MSSSYAPIGTNLTVGYGDGSRMFGFLSEDNIQIGSLQIEKQIFTQMTHIEQRTYFEFDVVKQEILLKNNMIYNFFFFSKNPNKKGILGMGYDSLSVQNVTTVFTNLFEQHQINGNKFSFWIDRFNIDHIQNGRLSRI